MISYQFEVLLVILFGTLPFIYIFITYMLFQYKIIHVRFSFQLQVFSFLSLTFLVSSRICTSINEVSRPLSGNFPSSRLLYHTPTIFLEIIFQQRTSSPAPTQGCLTWGGWGGGPYPMKGLSPPIKTCPPPSKKFSVPPHG